MQAVNKKYTWALKLFISVFLLSKLFTLLHWPYAEYLSLFSAVILIVFYPFRYLAKQNKVLLDHIKMALVIAYCVEIFFQLDDYIGLSFLQTILFFYWFVNEGFFYFDFNFSFKKNKTREQNILDDFEENDIQKNQSALVDILLISSGVVIMLSALFSGMHWPFATEMMLIGYASFAAVIWFKEF